MFIDNIKIFAQNEKEMEILIQSFCIYSQPEFDIEEFNMLIMKKKKKKVTEEIEQLNQERVWTFDKKERILQYWKRKQAKINEKERK